MKRFAPIAAVAVGALLLVGCESKLERNQHNCGLYKAKEISHNELNARLGVKDNGWRYCAQIKAQ